MTQLLGYADPLSVKAGDTVRIMLSGPATDSAEIALVRLIHADANPAGPGFIEREVDFTLPKSIAIAPQVTQRGAFARVNDPQGRLAAERAGCLYAFIQPHIVGGKPQAIASRWDDKNGSGYVLLIDADGYLVFEIGTKGDIARVRARNKLVARCWYQVAANWDFAAGTLELIQKNLINSWNSIIGPVVEGNFDDRVQVTMHTAYEASQAPFILAGKAGDNAGVIDLYNGKIDRAGLHGGVLRDDDLAGMARSGEPPAGAVKAFWDPARGLDAGRIGDTIIDRGPHHLDLKGRNRPIRCATGYNWDGATDCFRLNPHHYGAAAYYDDALTDCAWTPSLSLDIPADFASGVYALRVRAGSAEDHVTFIVTPATPRHRIAVLLPTYTYLAYANERSSFDKAPAEALGGRTAVMSLRDLEFHGREAFGLSTYDTHRSGAGICYSSSRRPILGLRPGYRFAFADVAWGLSADLSLLWWLENEGIAVDVITDERLHAEGQAAVDPYRVVLTGSHPEYYSGAMLDALEGYGCAGGRIAYLGGNGFYWVIGVRDDDPGCIEVRKLDGTRSWNALPGEDYLATTGERGGIWRARGRAPQKLAGVGFTSQGFDYATGFTRMADAERPEVAWLFEGIAPGEVLGEFGLSLGGAAGVELDRYDLALGTPPHALLLASSFEYSDNYLLLPEDLRVVTPGIGGTQNPLVRADMVLFSTPKDGAVFSVGSIGFCQALPVNGGRNTIATLVRNMLAAMAADAPLRF